MSIQTTALAKKYATAFVNLFDDELNGEVNSRIEQFVHFLLHRRAALVFLGLPHIPAEKKVNVVEKIVDKFQLPESIKKIVRLLISNNRQMIIAQVLQQILMVYRKRHHIEIFDVKTVEPLDENQKDEVRRFLETQVSGTVRCDFVTESEIIAGLRAQSNTNLWEYSVAKDIRNLKKLINC